MHKLIEKIKDLYIKAELEFTFLVNSLIQNKIKDKSEIEMTLDYLLSFADNENILKLYRRLCRYYYFIDPVSTAYYVNAYREMWDEDGELYNSGYFRENKVD